ncbi:MAG: response regulator [Cyclobacteriaceae bacterium]|nr:response regulator [Cyclobacteriaceae bacterium HetDA_MAG_MS6]
MKKVLPFWFLFAAVSASGSIDSLKAALAASTEIIDQIKTQNAIAWKLRDTRPDSALFYATKARKVAKEHGFIHDEIQAVNYIGIAYRNIGVYSKAFEKYLEALRMAEQHEDNEQKGYALINLGNLYLFQTNFQGAVSYFIQALDEARTMGDRRMQGYCYVNLGRSYDGMGEYGQAELYLKQAIDIREAQHDAYGIIAVQIELAEVYRKQGALDKSLVYTKELVERIDDKAYPRALIFAQNNLAKIYLAKGMLRKAEEIAEEALRLSKQVISRYDEKESLKNLSTIAAQRPDFSSAFEYYTNYAELNQQLFSEENIRKIEQLKNKYEIDQQEAENEFLRKQTELNEQVISRQKTIIALSVVGILLLLLLAVMAYRAFLIKVKLSKEIAQQRDKIEHDKNTIEKQSVQLQELDEAKSRFFANVSHDLRSPLSLILGNLEMVLEDTDTYLTTNAKKCLEVGFKNSKRLLYLTDEINDITKLEEGKISLKLERVRVNSYLRMLCDMFKSTAEFKGVSLSFESTLEDHETLAIDPRQFEKIFYNLVSNAIRHTQKGDAIDIRAKSTGGQTELTFSDSGEGIPFNSLPHVFDRFFQSAQNQYKSREGLGIGLALVKELVELHKGVITVSSQYGVGTRFTLTFRNHAKQLPGYTGGSQGSSFIEEQNELFRELDTEVRHKVSVDVTGQKENQSVILLVDDHPEIRYYIRQILEDNYHVVEAAHGLEALEILEKEKIDLIITDLMMPWMDGFELIESLNSHDEYKQIPLLVVSARISETDHEKVLYKGVNDYLQKPFQKKELVLRIENLINQKERFASKGRDVFSTLVNDNLGDIEADLALKLENTVKDRIGDPNLSVFHLADGMAASERQVYRLVKKLTGLTPHEYISEIRMQYVDYLIRKNKVKNATEAAKSIGLKNVTTFSRQYQKKFGVKPSELLRQ